jgi:hypothetical protein
MHADIRHQQVPCQDGTADSGHRYSSVGIYSMSYPHSFIRKFIRKSIRPDIVAGSLCVCVCVCVCAVPLLRMLSYAIYGIYALTSSSQDIYVYIYVCIGEWVVIHEVSTPYHRLGSPVGAR